MSSSSSLIEKFFQYFIFLSSEFFVFFFFQITREREIDHGSFSFANDVMIDRIIHSNISFLSFVDLFFTWIYPRVNFITARLGKSIFRERFSLESPLNLNWSDLAWFQHYNVQLNRDTALDYFCQIGNPFYDPSCLNEQIIRNFASAEAIVYFLSPSSIRSCLSPSP